jgi:hypothetical protein
MSNNIHYENDEIASILDQFYKAYVKLKQSYKDYDIKVVINGENNITIITDYDTNEQKYTYYYREDYERR